MTPRISRIAIVAAPLALACLPPAAGQMLPNNGDLTRMPDPAGMNTPVVQPPKPALPPGLPGARSSATPAPSEKSPADMEPTEALFDAINRGDIAAARDAISRGADLRGQNVLGMTPMELSVDLGRNDISFLLLSLRGDDGRRAPPLAAAKPPAKPAAGKATKVSVPAQRTAAPQTPRLFANDGGTPVPSAGFLGFDSVRR